MLNVPPESFEIFPGSTPLIVNPGTGVVGFLGGSVGAGVLVAVGILVGVSEGVIVISMVEARVGSKKDFAPETTLGCTSQDPMPSANNIVDSHKALYMVILL